MAPDSQQRVKRRRSAWGRLAIALVAVLCASAWVGWRLANGLTPLPAHVQRAGVAPGAPTQIVRGAHAQEGDTYDAAYRTIPYPGGDVAPGRGACTDVVIRALRSAGFDLQKLVHEDVIAAPHAYRIGRPDPNIDHRRVLNLMVFFERHGRVLPPNYSVATRETWQPGDIVCWRVNPRETHTGVISDGVSSDWPPAYDPQHLSHG